MTTSLFSKLSVKWFLIGFIVRLGLALVITLLIKYDHEAAMLYLADLPTTFVLTLAERIFPSGVISSLTGTHPYYIPLNLFACFLWGISLLWISLAARAVKAMFIK